MSQPCCVQSRWPCFLNIQILFSRGCKDGQIPKQKMIHYLSNLFIFFYKIKPTTLVPESMTSILSLSMTVFNLWAIVSTVQFLNFVLMVFWINSSVLGSTLAVASSKMRIGFFLTMARARHTSCLCPTLMLLPPSLTGSSSPISLSSTSSKARHKTASSIWSKGSRFFRSFPENRNGSWGIILMWLRRSCRPISPVFMPSISMTPSISASLIMEI